MRRIVPTIITLIALAIFAVCVFKPWLGEVTETWQTESQGFRIRVDRHDARGLFVPGTYYVFQSAPVGSDAWQEIFTIHTFTLKRSSPIPRENARFINSQIGYVFYQEKYAVSTDAGRSWAVWDAREADKNLGFEKHKLYPLITEVRVESNGRGRMRLSSLTDSSDDQPELQTFDYGRSWSMN